MPSPTRYSPVHDQLDVLHPTWGDIDGCPIALSVGDRETQRDILNRLALCDASALPKLGIKGPAAETWLTGQQVSVPHDLYALAELEGGGLVVRVADDEFLLESGLDTQWLHRVRNALGAAQSGAYRVERQDATFLLSGARGREVLAQTCGVDFATAPSGRLIMTRVALVSCGILPQEANETPNGVGRHPPLPIYRLWVDYTYAGDLWNTLAQIVQQLGGGIVGAAWHYPSLSPA